MAADRKQVQIAHGLVKFVSMANEMVDVAAWILREIDPETGVKMICVEGPGVTRDYTFGELKAMAISHLQGALGYEAKVVSFVQGYGLSNTQTAVFNAYGMDATVLKNELQVIGDEARYIISQLGTATTKADLILAADHIDANVPKGRYVRRSWIYA